MTNVILIDNYGLIRCGIKYILKDFKDLHIIKEATTCEEIVEQPLEIVPDIAIIVLNKFDISLLEGVNKLMRRMRKTRILIITDCMNEVILSYLLKSGVHGCLSMKTQQEEIFQAIKKINQGERYVNTDVAYYLAASKMRAIQPSPFTKLSNRELQVVFMIVSGLSSKEIAEKLFLSSKTISTYRNNIFKKLNVNNEVEMTLLAILSGLVEIT